MPAPVVELLYFHSCPNHEATGKLIERVVAAETLHPDVRLVEVTSADEAQRLHFLGSPTVRVNGHDIEPGADARTDFTLACRIYRTEWGHRVTPRDEWLRVALRDAETSTP